MSESAGHGIKTLARPRFGKTDREMPGCLPGISMFRRSLYSFIGPSSPQTYSGIVRVQSRMTPGLILCWYFFGFGFLSSQFRHDLLKEPFSLQGCFPFLPQERGVASQLEY